MVIAQIRLYLAGLLLPFASDHRACQRQKEADEEKDEDEIPDIRQICLFPLSLSLSLSQRAPDDEEDDDAPKPRSECGPVCGSAACDGARAGGGSCVGSGCCSVALSRSAADDCF